MATVASLLVKIGADTSELRKSLNGVKRNIRQAFGSDFLRVSNTAALAITGIGAAIAAAGAKAIQAAGNLQNVQTAFTNMLGSAEKASAFTKQLQSFAAATPFEFNQVTAAAQKFLAFGFTAEQVIPTLTAVGDAAAGVGLGAEGINRVTLALGQIAAKSKVQSDEMLQLTEAGIPAWQMLADKIGVSVPEAMDMVTKGMVDAQTGISALVSGMSQKFGGMMEQQSQTIQGTWSTMMDGLEQTAGQVGLRLAESLNITGIFQGIGETLNNFAQEVQNSGIAAAIRNTIPTEFQVAIIAMGTALVGVAIPAISLAATSLLAFLAPLGAAVAAAAPFIAAATAIASGLFILWQNGTTAADILEFFGIRLEIVNSFIDTAKSYFSQLSKTIQALLSVAQPVFTAFGVIAYAAFTLVINLMGGVIEKIMVAGNVILSVFNFALSVIEWAANGIGGFLQYIGDCFMQNSNDLLPEWATSAMKTISSFVGKAISWLDNLISKIFETNEAMAEADGKQTNGPKAPKKLEVPKYEQFKGTAPKIDPKKGKKTGTKKDPLLSEAENTSKQIAEEWYRTFSTKSALVDRWYKEESASLEKTKALNTSYEVDKQRLAELYAQKRIEALAAEEKEKADIINSARNAAMKSKTAGLSLYGGKGAKELAEMQLDYEKSINSISDRWAEYERNFIGMTEAQKSTYLEALKQYGVAFELNTQGQISFTQEAEKEKYAAFKDYQDKRLEYLNQCKDIETDVEKAYANNSYSALKNALRSENMARLSAYTEAQTIMQGYYSAATEAHQSFRTQLADAITESKNSFQTFFSDVLTMQTSFVDGLNSLLNNLFTNIVNQITAGWAASITQGALGFLMPTESSNQGNGGENNLTAFDNALLSATSSVNGLSIGASGANGVIGTSTGLLGAYNSIQSIVTGTTKPAEGAATTAVTAALTALSAAASAASVALSAISATSGFGFGLFSRGGVVKAAGGGSIAGAGSGTSDSIPAMLSNGEYVLTAASVNRLGIPFLDKLNAGDFPGYNDGGLVLAGAYTGGGNSSGGDSEGGLLGKVFNIVMNISTMDAESFRDFLERGGSDAIRQVAYEADRNFAGDKGVW